MMNEKIIEIIADIAMLDIESIHEEDRFVELGIDPLDMVEIGLSVEDIADVEIENIEDFKTVGELIEYVNDNI